MRDAIRIVFLADTHLGFDYPLRPRTERRRRGDDFFANFRRVLDYAVATKPDLVVHGGDLFFRSRVPPCIVDMVYAHLIDFAKSGIPFLIVPGNHERSVLPPSLWLALANVFVFDRPSTFHLTAGSNTIALSGFPFVGQVQRCFGDALEATRWRDGAANVRVLCMHQTVAGATVGPANYTFRAGDDVVAMSSIPDDFTIVLSGHIHRRQVLCGKGVSRKKIIVYAGSIERTSFAEKDEPKGFYEVELAQLEHGWHPRVRFIDLPTRPMVDVPIDSSLRPETIAAYPIEIAASVSRDAIVRLVGNGDGDLVAHLTASLIRSAFPPTMTVELSRSLYSDFRGRAAARRANS